jgi:hypothetical protein
VRLAPETIERLDAYAASRALSRSAAVAALVPCDGREPLTAWERDRGAHVRRLDDRAAYVALGRRGSGVREGTDGEILGWALSATVAAVADSATDADRRRILAWIRQGAGE